MSLPFLVFLVFLYQTSALQIYEPLQLSGHYLSPYYKHFGQQPPFNVTGDLTLAHPNTGCEPYQNSVEGKIVLVLESEYDICSPLVQANYAKRAGAIALIITRANNLGYYVNIPYHSRKFGRNTEIPTVDWVPPESILNELVHLLQTNQTIHLEITPEASPYDRPDIFIPISLILELLAIGCFSQSSYKLSQYIKYHGIQRSFPQLALVIEIFISIVRMLFFIEPFPYIGIFPFWTRDMLYTITYPFSVFSLMTLLLHWHKMVSPNTHLRSAGLSRLKWPLVIVTLLWTFVTVNLIIISALSLNGGIFYQVINSLYGSLLLGLIVFFVITSFRTIRFLKSAKVTATAEHTKKVIRMIVINSSALMILLTEIIIMLAVVRTMPVQVVIVTSTSAALLAMSYAQINIFDTPTDELTQPRQAVIDIPSSDSVLPEYNSSVARYPKTDTPDTPNGS